MLKGAITISAPHGYDGDKRIEYIQIEFRDKSSFTYFLRVDLSYEDFARALTGHGEMPCEFSLTADKVGLVHEHKREEVYMADSEFSTRRERAEEAVKALETDGWMGRVENALNHHRQIRRDHKGAWYSVSFVRYVEPEEAQCTATDAKRQ